MAKINLDPMPAARAMMVERINSHFMNLTIVASGQEQAWLRKREIATAVAAGGDGTYLFAQDAKRNDLTVSQFAEFILAKQDPVEFADAREDARQAALHAVEAAKSPDELQAIISSL